MANMNDTKEQGVALFIVQEDLKEKIYFEEYLPQRIKRNFKLSSEVLSLRNVLIIMAFIEVIASIWGFSYYFIRRSLIYVFVNITLLLLSILGIYALIVVQEICLMIYSLFITSLPGTFFIYQIFEFFAINDTKRGVDTRLNDNMLLFLFSIPYIYDFITGVTTILLLWRISGFNEKLRQLRQTEESQKLLNEQSEGLKKKYSAEQLGNILREREEKKEYK